MLLKSILSGGFEDKPKSFKCPTCKEGALILNEELNPQFQTAYSFRIHVESFNGFETKFNSTYANFYHCNNPKCRETAILTGIVDAELTFEYDQGYGHEVPNYKYKYTIKHIEPAVDLFEIPDSIPPVLKDALKKVFYIFWVDSDACANSIRVFVEGLLNHLNIPHHNKLHFRIEQHMQQSPDTKTKAIGNKLMAIKWIGNQGSHSSIGLTKDNVITALLILENVLKKIYDKSEIDIRRKVSKINKNKGI